FFDKPPQLAADATGGTAWPTFGGGPDRAGRVPGGIPNAWPARPTWVQSVPDSLPARQQPFGHPIILNGEVFVTDGAQLYGFDLKTGNPTRKGPAAKLHTATPKDANCSLTASDGLLYARIGPSAVAAQDSKDKRPELICLNPKPNQLDELWKAAP